MWSRRDQLLVVIGSGAALVSVVVFLIAFASPATGDTIPWLVAAAGLADGFNPCSFSGLLVFASFTVASFEREALACHDSASSPDASRRTRVFRNGSTYIVALFVTYLALGLGFLGIAKWLAEGHWIGKAAAVGAIGMGLWVLRDGVFPESRWKLEMPRVLRPRVRRYLQATEVPSIFAAGVLVGLCTVPCTGGIYLGVLGLLASQESAVQGFLLIILYNAMFVLPLVAVLAAANNRRVYRATARWHVRRKNTIKMLLGAFMTVLGLVTLYLLT